MKTRIKIGADPELFVRRKNTKQLISAHDLVPGTKTNPFAVKMGAIQVDGVAAEFNINPSQNHIEFIHSCIAVMSELSQRIGPDNELSIQPVAIFDKEIWDTIPSEAKELGCNPDFDSWTGLVTPKPCGEFTSMRTGAGHIHIGDWCGGVADPNDEVHQLDCRVIGRQMDYYLGLPSLMWDSDNKRRQLYGKAGCIRYKPYGVEYRSLSNAWLKNTDLMRYVWTASYKGTQRLIDDGFQAEEEFGDCAKFIIDNSIQWWTTSGIKVVLDNCNISNKQARTLQYNYWETIGMTKPTTQVNNDWNSTKKFAQQSGCYVDPLSFAVLQQSYTYYQEAVLSDAEFRAKFLDNIKEG